MKNQTAARILFIYYAQPNSLGEATWWLLFCNHKKGLDLRTLLQDYYGRNLKYRNITWKWLEGDHLEIAWEYCSDKCYYPRSETFYFPNFGCPKVFAS
jgi:hypothetical protein